jgi:hypothetical protein
MIITNQDIEDSKQNRVTFNKNYNDAVIDVLALKNDAHMSIKEIHEFTKYEINFIVHVINDYDKNKYENQNRHKFNKYYNDGIIDILTLKNECNMAIEEIKKIVPYDDDFIKHVLENYDINDNVINEKITEYNIEKLKDIGYNEVFISEVLNPEEKETKYYFPK